MTKTTDNTQPVVHTEDLLMVFNTLVAVDNINFEVQSGEVRGILGGNGAGKSTTLKILGGVIKATSGVVEVGGHNLRTYKGGNAARSVLGYCPDVGGLITGATPEEHIKLLASLHKDLSLKERGEEEVSRFGLEEFWRVPTSGFSHGMSRRLSVLLASLTAKELLILDEPFDGVDPLGVDIINTIIKEAQDRGTAVILSTHLQELLVDVSDTVSVMKTGRILDTLPAEKLRGDTGKLTYRDYLLDVGNEPSEVETSDNG